MPSIQELIEDYQEGDFLDFKQEEYKKETKHELIKDVLAFANSEHSGEKYIIIGIKKDKDEVTVFDIPNPTDSANIQQTIHDNIHPDIKLDYTPYPYDGKNLMILTIKDTTNQPYSTKKKVMNDSGKIALAENSFKIRKGSRTKDISRNDLDRIYNGKIPQKPDLSNKIKITFQNDEGETIQLQSIGTPTLPSTIEKFRLEDEILRLENTIAEGKITKPISSSLMRYMQNPASKLADAKTDLLNLQNSYKRKDESFLYEERGHKLQFYVSNTADFTLQNVSLFIQFEHQEGLAIGKKDESYSALISKYEEKFYPKVATDNEGNYLINCELADIKHKLKQSLLPVPLRIYFDNQLKGKIIKFTMKLHAENYPDILTFERSIEVI